MKIYVHLSWNLSGSTLEQCESLSLGLDNFIKVASCETIFGIWDTVDEKVSLSLELVLPKMIRTIREEISLNVASVNGMAREPHSERNCDDLVGLWCAYTNTLGMKQNQRFSNC